MKAETIKILILEDNQSDADLLERELKKNGLNFTSLIVETRALFEEALKDFEPDIILSDYSLPSFDGFAAFIITQSVLPDVPFIVVSGMLGEERAVELIKSGITDYVLKDKLFSLTPKIERALKEALERRKKKIADQELIIQHEKLLEIAFLQSHQVRVPVAHIIGLFGLFDFEDPSAAINGEIFNMLKSSVEALDRTVIEILQKTSEINYPRKQA
ncbi:response regulator receiver domain-containing protein [Mucilaginibacter gracilis]|uniref:Response regulator receiver domain-containing protein n=1 Tax=Mucilaginibacter gracilis TaxID=423350 RepID=A0A495J8Y6_9SPHI|nr:response regulator [Mucilaginibacter gracilis]RKR85357.1 response regulator receiver domain-containing protein [Mucilaginibacter gracilis]